MDHKEYKEMLALEALDTLEEDDARLLRTHLATCAGCQAELAELRDTAATLVYTIPPVRPSSELHTRVLERIHAQANGVHAAARETDLTSTEDKSAKTPSNILPLPFRTERDRRTFVVKRSIFVFGAIAAALVIAALGVPLVLLWNQNTQSQREIARLSTSLSQSQTALASTTERLRATQEEIARTPGRAAGPGLPPGPSPEPRANVLTDNEAGAEIARLSTRNNELQAELARATSRNDTLQTDLTRFSARNSELQTELAQVTNRSNEVQAELAQLQKRLSDTQTELASFTARSTGLQAEVARLSSRNNELQVELGRVGARAAELQTEIARQREVEGLLTAPDTRSVTLAGTKVAPAARAKLIYDPRNQSVALFAYDLPTVPAGKAYQLWFIAGSKPISAGVFTTDAAGRAVLRGQVPASGRKASTFAVTLEPASGSSGPTGDKYLLGTAS